MSIPIIDQLRPLGNFPAVDASDVQAGNQRLSTVLSNTPSTAYVDSVVENKVDKVEGKGLSTNDYTAAEKNKLGSIEANANNYVHPTTAGNKHIPSGGSSGQILRWASDGTAQWGEDHNTQYTDATTSVHGLMSTADKAKLNGIASGATNVLVDSSLNGSSTNAIQNKAVYDSLVTKADSSTVATLTSRVSDVETEQATLDARMDTFTNLAEGSTTGDAELTDIRVKADGTTATSAGGAVREQVESLDHDINNVVYSEELANQTFAANSESFLVTVNTKINKGETIRFKITSASRVAMQYQAYFNDGETLDYDLNINQNMLSCFDHVATKPINTIRAYRNASLPAEVNVVIERISVLDTVKNDLDERVDDLETASEGIESAIMGNCDILKSVNGKHITSVGIENAQNNNWIIDVYDLSNYKGLLNIKAYTRFVGDYPYAIYSDKELMHRVSLSESCNETNTLETVTASINVNSGSKYLVVQAYGDTSEVKKVLLTAENYDYKKHCARIENNGTHCPYTVSKDSGNDVIRVVSDGVDEFNETISRIFVDRNTDAYFSIVFKNPIPVEDVESVTIKMGIPLYSTLANGVHAGYFGIAPITTGTPSPTPVQYNVFSNSELSFGECVVKIPRSKLATQYFTGNLTGFSFKCIARSTVEDWFGGWTIADVQLNQKMKPCILLNFDQVWKESIDNGGYDLLYNNSIKFTMFTDNYASAEGIKLAELRKMEQYGNELSAYGGLVYGANLPAADVMEIVENNLTDLAEITDKPMFAYGCRQHYGNSKLINLLRMRGVKTIRFNPHALPLGRFTKNDYMIPATEITDQLSSNDVISMIDEAIANGSCLPLFTHGICASGQKYMENDDGTTSTSEGVPIDKMTTIINYIVSKVEAKEIECLTFTEFANSCY